MIDGWSEGVAGIFRHFNRDKKMLNGNANMHIIYDGKFFIGQIQLSPEFDEDGHMLYTNEEICADFKECADELEGFWEDLIKREYGELEYG